MRTGEWGRTENRSNFVAGIWNIGREGEEEEDEENLILLSYEES